GAPAGSRHRQRRRVRVPDRRAGRRAPGPVPARLPGLGPHLAAVGAGTGGCRPPGGRTVPARLRADRRPRRRLLPDRCPGQGCGRAPRGARRRRPGGHHRPRLGRHGDLRRRLVGARAVAPGGDRCRAALGLGGQGVPHLRPAAALLVHVLLPAPARRHRHRPGRPRVRRPALGGLVARLRRHRGSRPAQAVPARPCQPRRRPRVLPGDARRHPTRSLARGRAGGHAAADAPAHALPPRRRGRLHRGGHRRGGGGLPRRGQPGRDRARGGALPPPRAARRGEPADRRLRDGL
ncbi:MAG: Epoxide hydrolase, partial [uncultured Acidimicrobiales bacterium]